MKASDDKILTSASQRDAFLAAYNNLKTIEEKRNRLNKLSIPELVSVVYQSPKVLEDLHITKQQQVISNANPQQQSKIISETIKF